MQDRRCIYFNQPHLWRSGLACHEHLPILVTRFFVPAAEEGERSGFYKYAISRSREVSIATSRCCWI